MPPFLYNVFKKAYYQLEFAKNGNPKLLKANAELKNKGEGKKAFLIGTGPSLKGVNLKLLEGHDCFSVSNFFLHEDIQIVKPKLHFFAPFHPPLDRNNFIDWLREADQKLPAETNMVLGTTDYDMVQEAKLFLNRKVYYLYLNPAPSKHRVDLQKPVLRPQTSPLMILPVLIYMGYREINLIGCDHNVLKYFQQDIEHFYDVKNDTRKGASDKNVWVDIITQHQASEKVFVQYKWYLNNMKEHHFRLVNLSPISWLNFVPYNTFENATAQHSLPTDTHA